MLLLVLCLASVAPSAPSAVVIAHPRPARPGQLSEAAERARAAKLVGPEINSMNCASCHTLEAEAWQRTHHFSTFVRRHRTRHAQQILENLGARTMKRQADCRQCHYTSVLKNDSLMPMWGVSCESCHGPAKDWINVHNRVGGDPDGAMLKWGDGKKETKSQRDARLSAAEARGMITSRMIYELAGKCLQCHTVPDERLVNKGKHRPGSDFEFVSWSQGEVRHNFVDSRGAPNDPSNRRLAARERRRMYVAGVIADLQLSLRNLAAATQKDGDFADAMADRVNAARGKLAEIESAARIPEIEVVLWDVPEDIEASTPIPSALPARVGEAGKAFAAKYDGTTLAAIDKLIPTTVVGTPYTR